MSNLKSSAKNYRITLRNYNYNKKYKLGIKKAAKQYLINLGKKNNSIIQSSLSLVYKKIDKAIKKKVLHKNAGSRKKKYFFLKQFRFFQK
uniref:Ribosomal protein S20 n=1 Tax=Leachiella pacifica TaxID=282357 RepID=A0A3S8UVW1_9FLOR|nr:ribosomal protein S20 [Leachiella pacifica]